MSDPYRELGERDDSYEKEMDALYWMHRRRFEAQEKYEKQVAFIDMAISTVIVLLLFANFIAWWCSWSVQ